jgi:hypothetical protein
MRVARPTRAGARRVRSGNPKKQSQNGSIVIIFFKKKMSMQNQPHRQTDNLVYQLKASPTKESASWKAGK